MRSRRCWCGLRATKRLSPWWPKNRWTKSKRTQLPAISCRRSWATGWICSPAQPTMESPISRLPETAFAFEREWRRSWIWSEYRSIRISLEVTFEFLFNIYGSKFYYFRKVDEYPLVECRFICFTLICSSLKSMRLSLQIRIADREWSNRKKARNRPIRIMSSSEKSPFLWNGKWSTTILSGECSSPLKKQKKLPFPFSSSPSKNTFQVEIRVPFLFLNA